MMQLHYAAEVKTGLLLKLPIEAEKLHLKPGDKIEIQLDLPEAHVPVSDPDPTIALIESWIAQAPTDPEAIREAEEDLREFKRNMNRPRKEADARLPFPDQVDAIEGIQRGLEQMDQGEGRPVEEVFAEFRQRHSILNG